MYKAQLTQCKRYHVPHNVTAHAPGAVPRPWHVNGLQRRLDYRHLVHTQHLNHEPQTAYNRLSNNEL